MKSARHKELQTIIKNYYKGLGWLSIEEHSIKGKRIDVLAQNINTKHVIANEIELSPKHCLENITIDLRVGCNEVIIICESRKTLEGIKQKATANLGRNILSKVSFRLISEFIPLINNIKQKNTGEFNAEVNQENNLE